MDKTGLISRIIQAEGLKGADADARSRFLAPKSVKELEQLLNVALANCKKFEKSDSVKCFNSLDETPFSDVSSGSVWGSSIVESADYSFSSSSEKKTYGLNEKRVLAKFLGDFLLDSVNGGLSAITDYNNSVGWLNVTDRVVNGFKVFTGQQDRIGLQKELTEQKKEAEKLKECAYKNYGAFESQFERKSGKKYIHENVENLKDTAETFTQITAQEEKYQNLIQGIKDIKQIIRQEQEYEQARKHVRGPAAATLSAPSPSSHEKFGEVLLSLCNGDQSIVNEYMQKLSADYKSTTEIQKNLPRILDELQSSAKKEYEGALGGKSYSQYESEYNEACVKVFGKKDAKTLAKNFVENAKTEAAYTEIGLIIGSSILLPGSSAVKNGMVKMASKYGEQTAVRMLKAGMTFGMGSMPVALSVANAATSKEGFSEEKIAEIKEKFKNGMMYGGFGAYVSGPLGNVMEKILTKNPALLSSVVGKTMNAATETSADILFDRITSDLTFKESLEQNGIMNFGMMIAGGRIAKGADNTLNSLKITKGNEGTFTIKDPSGKQIFKTKDPNELVGFVIAKGAAAQNIEGQGVKVSDYTVSKADEAALREIHKIDKEAFAQTDPVADRFEDYLADVKDQDLDSYIIKDKAGRVSGYFQLEPMHGKQLYVYSIGVPKELRNTKSSFAALKQIQENIKEIALKNGAETVALHVDESNKPLVKLYEKFGFKTKGIEEGYFANGDNALYMEINVKDYLSAGKKAENNIPTTSVEQKPPIVKPEEAASKPTEPAQIKPESEGAVSFKGAETSAKASDLSSLKTGMESNAGVKLLEKYGFTEQQLSDKAPFLNSIIHDLGDEFADMLAKEKQRYTTETHFKNDLNKFIELTTPETAQFIHTLRENGIVPDMDDLKMLLNKSESLKSMSDMHAIFKEVGMDKTIDISAVWESRNSLAEGLFNLGDSATIRKNMLALKESGIKFDTDDGVISTLSAMGKMHDKSQSDIVAILKDIDSAIDGQKLDDSSLSMFLDIAVQYPDTFKDILNYGKLFGGTKEDFSNFAGCYNELKDLKEAGKEAIIKKMKETGCSSSQVVDLLHNISFNSVLNQKFNVMSEEKVEGLVLLSTKIEGETFGDGVVLLANQLVILDDKTFLKNVKLISENLPDAKLGTEDYECLSTLLGIKDTKELSKIINETKFYKDNPSFFDLCLLEKRNRLNNYINEQRSSVEPERREYFDYFTDKKNILKRGDNTEYKEFVLLANSPYPQNAKELYVLDDKTLNARGKQFDSYMLTEIAELPPEQFRVFKDLMVLEDMGRYNYDNPGKSFQLSDKELIEIAKSMNKVGAPSPDVAVARAKELLALHNTPGMKRDELSGEALVNLMNLPEYAYNRVKELYQKVNLPSNQIQYIACLSTKNYQKMIDEYFDSGFFDNYGQSFPAHKAAFFLRTNAPEKFDAAIELAKRGYKQNISDAVRILKNGFHPDDAVNKLMQLNSDIEPKILGKNVDINYSDVNRINDFYKILQNNKRKLQHQDRAELTDNDIKKLINGDWFNSGKRNFVKMFKVLDDEAILSSLNGKYDGVRDFLNSTEGLDFYGVEELPVLKENLSKLPTGKERFDKFVALMEVSKATSDSDMNLVNLIKGPEITDSQKSIIQDIFSSKKPYTEQIEDFITRMNVPERSQSRVRELLARGKFNNRTSTKTLDVKAKLERIEKNIQATLANDKMPQNKKDVRLAQLESQKAALANANDGTVTTLSPQAMAELTRIVEDHVNTVNNNIAFSNAIKDKIYTKHNINPSVELQTKLDYDPKYTSKLISGDSEFTDTYRQLIELMDTDPSQPLSVLRESIPENQQTRKLFEENGLDYEKWIKFDETFEKPFSLEVDSKAVLDSVQKNTVQEFKSAIVVNFEPKDRDLIYSILSNIYKDKFNINVDMNHFDFASNKGFTKPDGTVLSRKEHITLIEEFLEKIKEHPEFCSQKNMSGNLVMIPEGKEFLDHLEARKNDLIDVGQVKDMSEELYVRLSDDDDVGRNIFFGNHVGCCTSVQNCNGFAQPQHLMNTFVRGIEIVDKAGNSMGNSMCYFAKVDGKLTFIIDSFEANGKLGASKDVTDAILNTGKLICAEMGRPDLPVMLGPNYNKIDKSRLTETRDHTVEVIGRAPENTYIDCIGGRGDINKPAAGRSMNEVRNLAPISDSRPSMKGVEELSQRDVWNINQNAVDIARTVHENSAVSLKTIEKIFGLQKGEKTDGNLLMYREKGEEGIKKKYFRKVIQYDEMLEAVRKNELTPKQIAEGKKPLTPKQQAAEIKRLTEAKQKLISSMQTGLDVLADAQGARIVMDNPSPQKAEQITNQLINGVKNGDFEIIDFENYGMSDQYTYFTRDQIERISKACGGENEKIQPEPKIKDSNYTTTQLTIRLKNGTYMEIQIRGAKINDLAEAEHILYKIREKEGGPKDVVTEYDRVNSNPDLKKNYASYIKEWYKHARLLEAGMPSVEPVLPDGVGKALDMNYLMELVRIGKAH